MRTKSFFSAAIALAGVCSWSGWFAPSAHAAAPKGKAAAAEKRAAATAADKKKAAELHADEKSMKKQLQWEDKVMGPDDKRAELDKIARAHAINEKAEKEKERQAALEPVAPAPVKTQANVNRKSEVALPSTAPAEKPTSGSHEISPKLNTEAAMATPAPVKPADDKFIDKLLKEEHASSRKKANASDRELESLLAGVKSDKPAGRKRGDSVDDLLKSADKGPAMPAPRAAASLPEWAKTPEIAPSAPAPVAAKPAAKNDGVIQVVQGAASFAPAPPPPAPVATRAPTKREKAAGRNAAPAKAPVEWNDPFADKKSFASRDQDRFTPAASVTRKEPASRPAAAAPASDWNDPFADAPETTRRPVRRAAPTPPAPAATAPSAAPKRDKGEPNARPPGWKDPFTKAPTPPTHAPLAMRELGKSESSKWEIAAHHAPAHAASSEPRSTGGWSVLKKRPR